MSDVSCPTSTYCVAVDSNGAALFWNGASWSTPRHVNANGSLTTVSCSSKTSCVVVSDAGKAVALKGGVWLAPQSLGPADSYRISCPSSHFCAAVGANGLPGKPSTIATFNGHSWSSHLTSTNGTMNDRLLGVSCVTSTYCVAVNYDGQILTFDGTRWSPMSKFGPKGLISVSCPTTQFCMAVAVSGVSILIHETSWSDATGIPKFQSAIGYSVSCLTAKACVTLGLSGEADAWRTGKWSSPARVFAGGFSALASVSCSRSGSCVAIDSKGESSVRQF